MPYKQYVVDLGSFKTDIGFVGNDTPGMQIPSVLGRQRGQQGEPLFGEFLIDTTETTAVTSGYDVVRLVERGRIRSYEAVAELLCAAAADQKVAEADLSTDTIVATVNSFVDNGRQPGQLAQELFERLRLGNFYANNQSFFSMMAAGQTTGTVLEVTHSAITLVPFAHSQIKRKLVEREELGGCDVAAYLKHLLVEEAGAPGGLISEKTLNDIVQNCTVTALRKDQAETEEVPYPLPDGSLLHIPGAFRSNAQELLFRPSLYAPTSEKRSLTEVISAYRTALSTDDKLTDMGEEQLSSFFLQGGPTLSKNFESRLFHEMPDVPVIAPNDRYHSPFVGASIVGNLESFGLMAITKAQYDEEGPNCMSKLGFDHTDH